MRVSKLRFHEIKSSFSPLFRKVSGPNTVLNGGDPSREEVGVWGSYPDKEENLRLDFYRVRRLNGRSEEPSDSPRCRRGHLPD